MIEMALLFPILIMLIIGVFELGGAFKSYLTTSNAAREGTRILSARGTEEMADCIAVVKAAQALSLANDFERLQEISIFEASTSNGQPIPGRINTYTYSAGDPNNCTPTPPSCGSWTCTVQQQPTTRAALVGNGVSPALVGMQIVYRHDWYSGFPPFRGFITIDEQTISRLEPEGFAP